VKEAHKTQMVFSSLAGFIVRRRLSTLLVEPRPRVYEFLDATLLFADISGFTALSEKLASMGSEGAEEVTKIINGFFAPLIDIITKWGGDIYRFGGDAILSFFPMITRTTPAAIRALNAASESIEFVKKHGNTRTRAGRFRIEMHCGLTSGRVFLKDLKTDVFIGGRLTNNLMEIVDYASAGKIVVDASTREAAKGMRFHKVKKNAWQCSGALTKPRQMRRPAHTTVRRLPLSVMRTAIPQLKSYVPVWLYERIEHKPFFDQKDGEHRKAAVMFLHFGNIEFEKNPREASVQMKDIYSALTETIKKYDGWLNKIDWYVKGTRALVVFGFPHSYEDNEQRATLCAHELRNHNACKEHKLRIAVHAGSIFAAPVGSELRREYTVMGDVVNLAARLAAAAPDNAVAVSEDIFNKTYSLFEYKSLGEKAYKGKKKKIISYKMGDRKYVDRASLSRWVSESAQIVGRKKELKSIGEICQQVKKSKGHIMSVTGEAGIGKSRLVQESIKLLKNAGFQIIQGGCVSYGKALSYHPWIDIFNMVCGIVSADTLSARKTKVRKLLRRVDRSFVKWLPVVGEVLGVGFAETQLTKYLDAKIRKQKFFDIVFDILKSYTRKKPLCIVMEDLHWADSVSLELLNYIGRNIGDKKILVLVAYRPMKSKEEFMEKDYHTNIRLRELSKKETTELAINLLSIHELPDNYKQLIIDHSQGNPFYTEEIVKSLIEQGVVYEDEKGRWRFGSDVKRIQLPDTVEGVILSRIDRLEMTEKEVLQTASVLGREFPQSLIEGIYENLRVLFEALDSLHKLDLIRSEKERGKKNIRIIFKHVFTQEVAYSTLSFAKKRELHRAVGGFIEKTYVTRKEEFLGLLSHHFYKGEDYDKALLYSVEAGEKAKKVYANEEAIEFFTRAIDSYEKLEGVAV
jgi:class 3 adenylate cyclase/ABC-type dipeptide/oligopeptide/nickel transport system ATPase component